MIAPQNETFETISDAIIYVFRHEQTSLLSLDRICEVLNNSNLFIILKKQLVPCSSIARRRVSSTLSSSDLFVRAGAPRACLWAIRPNNPLFVSNNSISSSLEQMLTTNGPMTLAQFVETTELSGANLQLFERFLTEHTADYTCAEDGTYWFTGQPRPPRKNFDSISLALVFAFESFPNGASVEELHWYLCLSTVCETKRITRRCVSRELSRRQDLFSHLSRARYILIANANRQQQNPQPFVPSSVNAVQNPQIEKDNFTFLIQLPQQNSPQSAPNEYSIDTLQSDTDFTSLHLQSGFHDFDDHQLRLEPAYENDIFDPVSFFSNDFHFSFE
ncbi:hypothetical protein GPJ56_005973 [Histomonas meleagridis]|uniref:uncharacterized protein n=1 Tax=Histomonas meleagridis TaxID=135588 RepID=UPI003559AC19|nr:hypothetical protein GPJ56_005973 [Histomonas meleagridis]KAH0799379.1 hypothetical protein GO595_007780 [Histomonas meleagridis]